MFYSFLFDWYSIVAIIVAIKNALTQKEVTTATFAMQYSEGAEGSYQWGKTISEGEFPFLCTGDPRLLQTSLVQISLRFFKTF